MVGRPSFELTCCHARTVLYRQDFSLTGEYSSAASSSSHAKYVHVDRAAGDYLVDSIAASPASFGFGAWCREEVALEIAALHVPFIAMRPSRHPSLCGNGTAPNQLLSADHLESFTMPG